MSSVELLRVPVRSHVQHRYIVQGHERTCLHVARVRRVCVGVCVCVLTVGTGQARNMKHVIVLLEKALPPDAIPPPAAPPVFPLRDGAN